MAARKKPTRFQRTRVVVRAHPWLTWGVLASMVAVLGGIVPGVLWVVERFQTVDAAKMHSARDDQKFSWLMYGQAQTNTILLRNRLNDCNAKPISRAEKPACDQYRQEFEEQTQRAHDLYNQAMKIGKHE